MIQERFFQQRTTDLEHQVTRIRQEYAQLKREKDELERRYASQLGDLRDKLEESNNNNRSMQNYVNSLKTTYASVFNDPLPASMGTSPFARFTTTATTPSLFPWQIEDRAGSSSSPPEFRLTFFSLCTL